MNKEERIKVLQDIIQIPSENDHEEEVAKYIADLLQEHGIDSQLVEYAPGRSSLVAEIKGQEEGKVLVYSGHLDVVAAGDHEEWSHDPFGAEIVDGKMYGRGTTDMKSGLAAIVIALIELKEANADLKGTLRLALTVGEEIGMLGSEQLVDEGYLDDADAFLIAEPSGNEAIINAHKGSIQYEVIAHGESAHSSMPEEGIDAIQLLVDYINIMNDKFDQAFNTDEAYNDQLGRSLNVNTVIEAGTQINSVASKAVMKANTRVVPEAGNDLVVKMMQDTMDELNEQNDGRLELNLLQNNPAAESSPDNALVKAIQASADWEVGTQTLAGATDASNFGRISDDYDLAVFGPGETSRAHKLDEYVEVADYLKFIDLYIETAKTYLA
ncbi:ArgE/DapE family deacylase [Aerococcus sanguinicola]|uniref:ArgE/DapE family deacylase n=1 Tax=unclassified Aerococcus TaxID=2618060 RepID=UPI0013064BCF|nr:MULTISPECIES: ArgE/DapE family deacylase [unclassified Aerococcus]KAB0646551.1 ArgE/DapE family deacylase [Aerococcus sanguinicola]MDK6233783.1 ArgE/DapE family deacylase [Aerococcus sp. UMB10185]MDK6805819.1 ArgE/DapE family deacylase [Aerococcus sp. UMB7834]MDK6855863.1 ArgE/DapE family deacylase [Aerococcus sp. UMB7533]